ncbi:MAG: kynureninase [Candidatus Xenobia bacterium]
MNYIDDEAWARQRDEADVLQRFGAEFHYPPNTVYLTGNSLGLQPKRVAKAIEDELEAWRTHAVGAHFEGARPWFSYHEQVQAAMAAVVGAQPQEVVMMNSLTTNLHLMMVSFYRPQGERRAILIEESAFPSDRYAVDSQLKFHGHADLIIAKDAVETLQREGHRVALVLWPGVHYLTGETYDLKAIADAGHAAGASVGFDLAHAAGNLLLKLHDSGADFAVWCSYKYLNSGPGGVGGCFVHERHACRPDLPRFAGWWGHDPNTRFAMGPHFEPQPGAAGWQLSNAPVLPLAVCRASLELFTEAGMPALREKSVALTGYLEWLIGREHVVTPAAPEARGCQLSLRFPEARKLQQALEAQGIICDAREPDILRVAPVPLYNSFHDVWRFARTLQGLTGQTSNPRS